MVFSQFLVFDVDVCPFISKCNRFLLIFCRILFTFGCFSIMFWLGFSGFRQSLLDFVELRGIAFHFCSFLLFFLCFGRFLVCFVVDFSRVFYSPSGEIPLPILFKFFSDVLSRLVYLPIPGDYVHICDNIIWFNVVQCRFLFDFRPI